jgi:glycogen synthase
VHHYSALRPVVVPNGRDPSGYAPAAKEPFILTSGRAWDVAKNVAAVDAAARTVPWPVWLAGDVQRPHGGVAEVRHLRALGRLSASDLRSWYARASIYTLPALYEPFGLSVLEAALSGCALVLADIPSLRENWDTAAWFVNPRDPRDLSAALAQLCADAEGLKRLAHRARVRALQFTPERTAEGYLAGYRLAENKRAASCA